jgi:hypothetical protein
LGKSKVHDLNFPVRTSGAPEGTGFQFSWPYVAAGAIQCLIIEEGRDQLRSMWEGKLYNCKNMRLISVLKNTPIRVIMRNFEYFLGTRIGRLT